ncbi:MarR family winged helix-turn-helix transcriptional regulator [Desulfovibrio sp. Fe33]|uniref:MarR family winged helix-turn-helix transcriptional regulator n=1 Tax=Desulfovibrio sp. Fe33 TaxID=3020842 RepID=UPI00234D8813|nr:MarR family winged helix-turn-helix transcriptional regulator [Desulfovibrio sp. Fe33]
MNKNYDPLIPDRDVAEFLQFMEGIFQCCRERMQDQSERFDLPDAELRCLLQFDGERYLTAKTLAYRLNVAKSRVTKLVSSLIRRGLLVSLPDPADSRVKLLSLTPKGGRLLRDISIFRFKMHRAVLEQFSAGQRVALLDSLSLLSRHMKSAKDMVE